MLKEIGRGGMSVVYLAMDTRLNRNWAVKEVRKTGNGINDDIVIGSILAEANLIKSLDHPAIPRIVDIIECEDAIYIVMDFIEGVSLDKILFERGPISEEEVIDWGMQACDVLNYLHSHNPPIIYRDMKPANLMLKPNGRLCIIDFGIAMEYRETGISDTAVLGTKGYAPPEQYTGRADHRSDIYALGMTMHQLLTGNDPRKGEGDVRVREWNPNVSEGLEAIIDKCTRPEPEDRYQSCRELMEALEDPSKETRAWKKRIKRKIAAFAISAAVSVMGIGLGTVCNARAVGLNNEKYTALITAGEPQNYYDAIEIYPERTEAYMALVGYYSDHIVMNKELSLLGKTVTNNAGNIGDSPQAAGLYYDAGRLILSQWEGSFKARASVSAAFFRKAAGISDFENKELARYYSDVCDFMTEQNRISEHSAKEYRDILKETAGAMDLVEAGTDGESNYERISLYSMVTLFIENQSVKMAALGIGEDETEGLLRRAREGAEKINSTLPYVLRLQEKMKEGELI